MEGSANGRITAAENVVAFPQPGDEEDVSPVGVARHRRHRFPGRTESVRARYDTDELAAVAAAADRAGLMTSGTSPRRRWPQRRAVSRRTRRGIGSCWASCCRPGWRSAAMR